MAIDLKLTAREIFETALESVNAEEAVRRVVNLDGSQLTLVETSFDLLTQPRPIYSIAIGKAARPMAQALGEILGDKLTEGIASGPTLRQTHDANMSANASAAALSKRWHCFDGGHPLPTEESLAAARAAIKLLKLADDQRALIIFLISGGGSAMMELPRDEKMMLADLRTMNRALVNCGASITEVNAVRSSLSAVKGGGLAAHAPRADQVSLIISDTGKGKEATVASGPTFDAPRDEPDARSVVKRYNLASQLPATIIRALEQPRHKRSENSLQTLRANYVLLDNESAITAAADAARSRGFAVEIADDLVEQPVNEGCAQLIERLLSLYLRTNATERRTVCLISGGEFSCPVRGNGTGGRNAETVLRCAIGLNERAGHSVENPMPSRIVILSAGTDGIDGNSPAAGAIADETTITRARRLKLDAQKYLDESDAHTFFNALGDTILTGPTGTNVRDLRIMLAS